MRLAAAVLASVLLAGSVSFAAPKGANKKYQQMCKEENPEATRAELKKCVKTKAKEAKRK